MPSTDPRPEAPRRILVTGGAGFIGHRTVSRLLEIDGYEAVGILDNLSVGMPMPEPRARLSLYEADIREAAQVEEVFADFRPDTLVHLAAVHHIPTCERERAYALHVNIVGTENLLASAERSRAGRVVLASSGAVYGWSNGALEESAPLAAADNYSLAKLTNEQQLGYWVERTQGIGRIARVFNTIGHDDPNGHLIPDIIKQISPDSNRATISLGNLTPRRDYIHADDTARGFAAIVSHATERGLDAYNVGSGSDVSVGELVALLGDVMGVQIDVTEDPARKRRVDRPSQLAAVAKLRAVAGFSTSKTLRDALSDIVSHATSSSVRLQRQ